MVETGKRQRAQTQHFAPSGAAAADSPKKKSKSASKKAESKPKSTKKATGGKKEKKAKDPNAPKRPMSSFFLYSADHRAEIKKAHPGASVSEVAKYLGEAWAKVSASEKKKYEDIHAKAKTAYEAALKKYEAGK